MFISSLSYASSNYKGLHGLEPTDPEHGRPRGSAGSGALVEIELPLVYRCSIEGYQDTLDAGVSRERNTVDFVFGYARAIFVGCRLQVHSSVLGASKPNVVIT